MLMSFFLLMSTFDSIISYSRTIITGKSTALLCPDSCRS
jgi:hypothetical protein